MDYNIKDQVYGIAYGMEENATIFEIVIDALERELGTHASMAGDGILKDSVESISDRYIRILRHFQIHYNEAAIRLYDICDNAPTVKHNEAADIHTA